MNIEKLERRNGLEGNKKHIKAYDKLEALIEALGKKDIPSDEMTFINARINVINYFPGSDKELTKELKSAYSQILKFLNEKLKLVEKNHYLSLGMVFGMLAGIVISSIASSIGILGIEVSTSMGISLGMVFGIIVGTNLDKLAEKKGNQLEV